MIKSSKIIITKVLPITILFVTINSVIVHSNYISLNSIFNNTTIWWIIFSFILFSFALAKLFFYDKSNNRNMIFVFIYLLWNLACIIRGSFVAETYWDWKALVGNMMVLLLPIFSYAATNIKISQSLLAFYMKYVVPLFIVFAFIIRTDAWGFYLMGASFLLLFLPIITKRNRLYLAIIAIAVIAADLGARSNVIKFGIPVLFLSFYYLRNIINIATIRTLMLTMFFIPILLFILGASGIFNIFKINDYIKKDIKTTGVDIYGDRSEISLIDDTRTFLYVEVLESAINNNYWVFGRTPARGNDSLTFGLFEFEWTGRYERLSNEIGLANIFTWTGIIGVIIYFLLFFHASSLAINKSNNIFSKILGLYIAFRWMYSWIEDYQNFTINFLLLWMLIGLCLSNSFRKMRNEEVKYWARGIFDTRYVRLENIRIKKELYERAKNSSITNLSQ